MLVFSGKQTVQHIQIDLLHHHRTIPDAAPEELTVIGSMGRASQRFGQPLDRCAMAKSDGHHQSPEVLPRALAEVLTMGQEKTLQFFRNSADSNHKASFMRTTCSYKSYRQDKPFFLEICRNYKITNRPA